MVFVPPGLHGDVIRARAKFTLDGDFEADCLQRSFLLICY
jgi:hypothetical protein